MPESPPPLPIPAAHASSAGALAAPAPAPPRFRWHWGSFGIALLLGALLGGIALAWHSQSSADLGSVYFTIYVFFSAVLWAYFVPVGPSSISVEGFDTYFCVICGVQVLLYAVVAGSRFRQRWVRWLPWLIIGMSHLVGGTVLSLFMAGLSLFRNR